MLQSTEEPKIPDAVPSAHASSDALSSNDDAIAIVGMAVRLSGGVNSPEEFWDALIHGKDGLCEVPGTRYNIDGFYDAHLPHSVATRKGYYLEHDPMQFDAGFFGINAMEAESMDPQQRQLLEVTWECLESAGLSGSKETSVGCYVGVFGNDWLNLDAQDSQSVDRFHISGAGPFALSNRLSYCFDWRGPSITIQTACSSSLVGLHEACQALNNNSCRSAVVAGVNLIVSPTMTMAMSDTKVLSKDGTCKTFDEAADGYGRGEGISVVCIKRLGDAIRDNDHIRGIIRATSTNHNGKTPVPTSVCLSSQENLIKQTYNLAKIQDITKTALFECHGTGTQAGDMVEVGAIARVAASNKASSDPIILSSTKPNFGHTEGASGLVSVIKSILCLENDSIPPSIFFKTPNPEIPFEEANLIVPRNTIPFPLGKEKRVSVNCFGVGGSNAHAIIDAAPTWNQGRNSGTRAQDPQTTNLFTVSAKDADALEARISSLLDYALLNGTSSHCDIAYTLACRRRHFAYRAFAVAHTSRPLAISDFHQLPIRPISPIWVFTGQGSQWAGMARQLCQTSVEFRKDMEELSHILKELDDGPDWSITEELIKSTEEGSRVHETELAQPLCTALTIGVVNQLDRWGLKPSAVIGHSSGEMAAAYASGAITAASAIKIAYYRGIVAKSQEGRGGMTAIALGWQELLRYLRDFEAVSIACRNGPDNTVISGKTEDLESVTRRIKQDLPEVFCRRLRVSVPYHSLQMKEPAAEFEKLIAPHLQFNNSMIPMYSTSSMGKLVVPSELQAAYWSNGMISTVKFEDGVKAVVDDVSDSQLVFVELGPHSALSGPLRQIFQGLQATRPEVQPLYIPTLTRNDMDARAQLLSTVGRLHCLGASMNLQAITGRGKSLSDLGTYPWKRSIKVQESRIVREWRLRSEPHHELLGSRVTAMPDREPAWRNILRLGDVLWLGDHVICGEAVFPAAGYVAMAGAASRQLAVTGQGYSIKNLSLKSFLRLKPGQSTEILTTLKKERYNDITESDWYTFSVSSHDGKDWSVHCTGKVRSGHDGDANPGVQILRDEPEAYHRSVSSTTWYRQMRKLGYEYGQSFRNLTNTSVDPVNFAAVGSLADDESMELDNRYMLHPTKIDQCLQLMGIAAVKGLAYRIVDMQVPVSVDQIYIAGGTGPMKAWVNGVDDGNRSLRWEAVMKDQNFTPLLCIQNLRSATIDQRKKSAPVIPLFASLRWKPLLDLYLHKESLLRCTSQSSKTPATCGYETFLDLLAHSKPSMRVLHVHASADDTAQTAMNILTTSDGVQLFSTYTYSDTTNVALDAARLRFNHASNVVFKIFDPNNGIKKQGMEEETFDLIIVTSIHHSQTQASLEVLRRLLRPAGWLFVRAARAAVEIASDSDENTALEEGLLDNDKWQHVNSNAEDLGALINAAGFKLIASSPHEEVLTTQDSSDCTTYICQALDKSPETEAQVVLLTSSPPGDWENELASKLASKGYHVTWSTLNNPPLPDSRVISLLDLGEPAFKDLQENKFYQLRDYLTTTKAKDTLWVTRTAQITCEDPSYGLVHGLLRTLRREMSLQISILELASLNSDTANSVIDVHEWIQKVSATRQLNRDYEFVAADDHIYVGRYHWENSSRVLSTLGQSTTEAVKKLCLPASFLEDSSWMSCGIQLELGADDVEVDICYIGLNFRDVMIAMGLVGTASQFGLEASGRVRRVGASVKDLCPGDHVGILSSGMCQSRILTPRHTCWKIPNKLRLESAAAITVPYLTAMYAILHAANLQKHSTVLIHSACGGVGLAAIRICQAIGAKIYATVGSEEKVQYLVDHCSLSRDSIFYSRDSSFAEKVMEATGGKGVDVVLNSLAGKLLHASWQCVASFGKMIELGKVDFATNGSLTMTPFAKNRAFMGVDLLDMGHERPELLKSLVDELLEWIEHKGLNVDTPLTIYEAAKTSEALRHMKQGQHIGKLLLRMPVDLSELPGSLTTPDLSFLPSATYMLIGGLGGLGRTVANWIVEQGAKDIVFVGRTAGQSLEDSQFAKELVAQGCSTTFIPGNVAKSETVKQALAACRYPLRGIFQMSAVLRDRVLINMTHRDWQECLEAKVQGTLNIHNAIKADDSLDFFVLFGSLAGVCGNGGQTNYAAANSFLESFAQFRQRQGLACSVLNLGPVEDVGMISRDNKLLQAMRAASVHLLSEKEVLQGLQVAIARSRCGSASLAGMNSDCIVNVGLSITTPIPDTSSHSLEAADARFAVYANLEENTDRKKKPQVVDSKFRSLITRIEENPLVLNDPNTELLVCRELGRLITGYLGDGSKMSDEDFAGIAIDSLMAIEIKDWVRGNMNMDIGMDQTSRSKTVGELARYTVERLQVTHGLCQDD